MYTEDEFLPLSALQHLIYCERRCALVHLEKVWIDNIYTAEGTQMHERTDTNDAETRKDLRIVRGLMIHSFRLGLIGKADTVEFHKQSDESGIKIQGKPGRWKPFPVEYKRGRKRREKAYEIQLCAQAICLEEMLKCKINNGALYFGQTKRRMDIEFNHELRRETEKASLKLHGLLKTHVTPPAVYTPKCDKCSLFEICQPKTMQKRTIIKYLESVN